LAIANVICRGYGPSASIAAVITRGYLGFPYPPGTPQAGYQYITASSGPWAADSIFDALSTAGNVAEVSATLTPSVVDLDIGGDGVPFVLASTNGRQSFQYREYDGSQWIPIDGSATYSTYYINDQPPIPSIVPAQSWTQNAAITPVILDDYMSSPQGDTLVWTGGLPTGLSVASATYNSGQPNQRTVQQVQGAPSGAGAGTIALTGTDSAGSSATLSIGYTTFASTTTPNFVGQAYTDAVATLQGISQPFMLAVDASGVSPLGQVTGQSPNAGDPLGSQTTVVLTVSGLLMPNVIGLSYAEAVTELTAVGLTDISANSPPASAVVIGTTPAPLVPLYALIAVTLTLGITFATGVGGNISGSSGGRFT